MYIITGKFENDVKGYGRTVTYLDSGYPYIADMETAYMPDDIQIMEVDSVPEGIEIGKYCYTPADGFYPNPNYQEPNEYGIPDELVTRIKNDAVTEIEEAVTNGTYE